MLKEIGNWIKKNGKKLVIAGAACMVAMMPLVSVQAADQTQTPVGVVEKELTAVAYNVGGAIADPFCMGAKGAGAWAGNSSGVEAVVRGTCGFVWGAGTGVVIQGVPRAARFIGDIVTFWQPKQYSLKPCEMEKDGFDRWVEATKPPF